VSAERLAVALVTDVFHGADGASRLHDRLREARALGAEAAILPEIPLNPWRPVVRTAVDDDAEAEHGPRQQTMEDAARSAGVALLGGAIVRDGGTGRRHNTAVVYSSDGGLIARYRKVHLPSEEGFWESDHYEPGDAFPEVVRLADFPVGVQICSDVNRPAAANILGARGALAVLVPRATPPETYPRWRMVLRASAVTSSTYLVSVNRPAEAGMPIGGPSVAIGPDGEVIAETTEPVVVVPLERTTVLAARKAYPGYLSINPRLYAGGWEKAAAERSENARRD
jgi:N-carbamoylputrescine amidase